ncbi:hypothetical protein FPV67DRAFT_1690048 [Lyophyllum atratum]|nr:hypothetical protein FPV67DRAFT_1690048 [Lyophyllum atratum]
MDVSAVKAEIKAWERSFRSSNGRDPTVHDIKLHPDIADNSDPPSTPPRSRSRSHQPLPTLLSQSRAIVTTAPLSSFNPFSPVKNKGKGKASAVESHSNPFTSPIKSSLNLTKPSASSVTPPHSPLETTTAISRARKRLRGEPVSPSPNKGKRRRVGSQTILPFAKLAPDSSSSEGEGEHNIYSSFVSNSPVKAPAGGKSFKLLFDESSGSTSAAIIIGKGSTTRTKSIPPTRGLFRGKAPGGLDDDGNWDLGGVETIEKGKHIAAPFKPPPITASGSVNISKANIPIATRKTVKRSLSDTELEAIDAPRELSSTGPSLLPPSPPPVDPSTYKPRQSTNSRGKGKAVPSRRKKAKTGADDNQIEEDEDDSGTLDTNVKLIDRTQMRFRRTTSTKAGEGDDDPYSDPDPILGYSSRFVPRGREAALAPDIEQAERFEVDLPDKLQRVLALETAESKIRDSRDERVVQGLVFGRRVSHYDPAKGGEIWDVGEDDLRHDREEDSKRDTEGEDEWEGEPVPWEVGEL